MGSLLLGQTVLLGRTVSTQSHSHKAVPAAASSGLNQLTNCVLAFPCIGESSHISLVMVHTMAVGLLTT